jgi:hypothetical protein
MKCPYCGVSSDVAHETQEACIEALHAEIARVRDLLQHVRSVAAPGPVETGRKDETDPNTRRPTKV